MSDDSSNMAVEKELHQLEKSLACALERLRAASAQLNLDTIPSTARCEEKLARLRSDVECACFNCSSLLRELEELRGRINGRAPSRPLGWPGITAENMKWAREQPINEEEILAGIREIEQTGGLELRDFIQELERTIGEDE